MYDVAIIGAGINGATIAHEVAASNKRVIVFEKEHIAAGGSGAAGAFISPKFSKSGELKERIGDAFVYACDFYSQKFPHIFHSVPLVHLAKDEKDAKILRFYKETTALPFTTLSSYTQEHISLDAGVVDAAPMCHALLDGIEICYEKVEHLIYEHDHWVINHTTSAKKVVLATGAYEKVIDEPYIQLRGVWGHRIDIKTSTRNRYSLHQFVSISQDNDGVIAIGATHNVHYHPEKSTHPYDFEAGRKELLEKASATLALEDVVILKDYTGLRSGSFDYLPLVGPLVDSHATLQLSQKALRVKHPDFSKFVYYPNLYMINGSGGYGFVLAPYLAKLLYNAMFFSQQIPQTLTPARFFARWAKRR